MDCETFQNSEIDALYGELDAAGMAAMAEHAATCAECGARLERLRSTRGLVLSVAVEAVPTDFEARIMAAVDGNMATRRRGPALVPPGITLLEGARLGARQSDVTTVPPMSAQGVGAPPPRAEGGAKIFAFMSRPAFAVAATFILVIGAAAILMQNGLAKRAASLGASDESAPAAVAATAVPMPLPEATAAASFAQAPAAVAPSPTARSAAGSGGDQGAVAALEKDNAEGFGGSASRPSAAMAPPPSVAAKPALAKRAGPADDKAFIAAKALYNQGRYNEALPKFEALKADIPEAELYAARCIAKTRGCGAATARFDEAAKNNAGTEVGSRAGIEGAKCYQATGDVVAARKRLEAAKDEGILASEAKTELDALDHKSGAGTPGAAGHAAPKAPARPSAPPALK